MRMPVAALTLAMTGADANEIELLAYLQARAHAASELAHLRRAMSGGVTIGTLVRRAVMSA